MHPEQTHETIVYESHIKMPYKRAVGETGSFFFNQLRAHAKIWGTRCDACRTVYMPPRRNCPRCFQTTAWVQLPPGGTLVTFTVIRYPLPAIQPAEPPYACGIIRLDGADTGLVHLLGEVEFEQLMEGMRVEAVFKPREERAGTILDIAYFKPQVSPAQ